MIESSPQSKAAFAAVRAQFKAIKGQAPNRRGALALAALKLDELDPELVAQFKEYVRNIRQTVPPARWEECLRRFSHRWFGEDLTKDGE